MKLDFEQRKRANLLVDWVLDNPEEAAYELIGLRDAVAANKSAPQKLQPGTPSEPKEGQRDGK